MTRQDMAHWLQQADDELLYTPDLETAAGANIVTLLEVPRWSHATISRVGSEARPIDEATACIVHCRLCGGAYLPGDTVSSELVAFLTCMHLYLEWQEHTEDRGDVFICRAPQWAVPFFEDQR